MRGSTQKAVVSRWKNLTVEGKAFWATGIVFDLVASPGGSGLEDATLPKPDLTHYHNDKNICIAIGPPAVVNVTISHCMN